MIPVLDVLQGNAVHAVAGQRSHYRPVRSRLHPGSEPLAIARAYRDRLAMDALYLADLDAIQGAEQNFPLYEELTGLGLSLWIDAGLRDTDDANRLGSLPGSSLVVGLETVRGPEAVRRLLDRIGPDRLVFSMDLHGRSPRIAPDAGWPETEPVALGRELLEIGIRRLILLDLARVGTGRGTGTEGLLRDLLAMAPADVSVEVTVGGGIASLDEVVAARAAGASGVLLGSTLHDGRITRTMLDQLRVGTHEGSA